MLVEVLAWAVVIAIIARLVIVHWPKLRRRRGTRPEVKSGSVLDDYFVAPASESSARAARVLPTEGSEDRRSLLERPALPEREEPEGDRDYLPNPEIDWAVRVTLSPGTIARRAETLRLLDPGWLKDHRSPEIYGRALDGGSWTYLGAAGVPEEYLELIVAWKLIGDQPDWRAPSAATLQAYQRDVQERLSALGLAGVSAVTPPAEAVLKAAALAVLKASADQEARIVLRAPASEPYSGRAIWDVMLCLGLEWGDMDLFHWPNLSSVGGDELFSVWTSTPPGYFLPEHVAADRVRTEDLVFGYSVPRSPAPEAVFRAMLQAARYAQHRLGGELLDGSGQPLDDAAALSEIGRVVRLLQSQGFEPGEGKTLYLF